MGYGNIKKFSYEMPSALKEELIRKDGYLYIPDSCPGNVDKMAYFFLGAGTDISSFVCEGKAGDFFFKKVVDYAVDKNQIPKDIAICFLSHCEWDTSEHSCSKEDEIRMGRCFIKNLEEYVLPKVENEILPKILPEFEIKRENRVFAGFSFGGALLMEGLDKLDHLCRNFAILSGYHLKKIENPFKETREILKEYGKALYNGKTFSDVLLIGITGVNDIAYEEMKSEFEILSVLGILEKKNLIFMEVSQGMHSYFEAAYYFVMALEIIFNGMR